MNSKALEHPDYAAYRLVEEKPQKTADDFAALKRLRDALIPNGLLARPPGSFALVICALVTGFAVASPAAVVPLTMFGWGAFHNQMLGYGPPRGHTLESLNSAG